MYFAIKFKSYQNVACDCERFESTFVGSDKLKKFFSTNGDVRRDANALDVGIINESVDFGGQFDHMSF